MTDTGEDMAEAELTRLEADLDSVESALKALDDDDLDTAEAVVASLHSYIEESASGESPAAATDGSSDEA